MQDDLKLNESKHWCRQLIITIIPYIRTKKLFVDTKDGLFINLLYSKMSWH